MKSLSWSSDSIVSSELLEFPESLSSLVFSPCHSPYDPLRPGFPCVSPPHALSFSLPYPLLCTVLMIYVGALGSLYPGRLPSVASPSVPWMKSLSWSSDSIVSSELLEFPESLSSLVFSPCHSPYDPLRPGFPCVSPPHALSFSLPYPLLCTVLMIYVGALPQASTVYSMEI